MNDSQIIALEISTAWLNELDANYLIRENRIYYWKPFFENSERGEWIKLSMAEAVRLIKMTRSSGAFMRYVDRNLLMQALQESGRVYERGMQTKGAVPDGVFNFNRAGTYSKPEMLILSVLRVLQAMGWNTQVMDLIPILQLTFEKKGFKVLKPGIYRKMVADLCEDADMKFRDRKDRLYINGVGRFCCVHINGINETIKLDWDDATRDRVAIQAIAMYDTNTGEAFVGAGL